MSCEYELTKELSERGFRITPQRRVILHILRHANAHLTPAEVYEEARVSLPGLTETTVYRTLEFLAQVGLAQEAFSETSKSAYEIGGYLVLDKWLKSHKGRKLDIDDIEHFTKIITVLSKTIEIQAEIDKLYPEIEESIIKSKNKEMRNELEEPIDLRNFGQGEVLK